MTKKHKIKKAKQSACWLRVKWEKGLAKGEGGEFDWFGRVCLADTFINKKSESDDNRLCCSSRVGFALLQSAFTGRQLEGGRERGRGAAGVAVTPLDALSVPL